MRLTVGFRFRAGSRVSMGNRLGRNVLAGLVALLLGTSAVAAEPPSRKILHNGKIFTSDPARPWAEAIAIVDNRIQAVGSNSEVMRFKRRDTQLIDLEGRAVVPGINDAHVHALFPPGIIINDPSYIPAPGPTLAEVQGIIAAVAPQTPPGATLWVIVGTAIIDGPQVTRSDLDPVSGDHPVILQAWTGHGMYLNTNALQFLGISETEPDPFGGRYVRFEGTEILTGEAHEYAEYQIMRRMYDRADDAELIGKYQAYSAAAVSLGFTSAQDMATGLPYDRTRSVLHAANLPLRVRSISFPLSLDEGCGPGRDRDRDDDDRVTTSGIKWIADGTPLERLAFLNEPYADRPDQRGQLNFPQSSIETMLRRGLRGSPSTNQMLFHTVGDGAIDTVLAAMEATGGPGTWRNRRTRLEHADLLFPENFERARRLGIVVVQNGTHLALPQIFAQRYTPDILAKVHPMRSLLDANIPLALGTDGIGQAMSPWVDIFLTMIEPNNPAEAITITEAVTAYTRGSAYAEFKEREKGTLKPGYLADLAVLSQDIFAIADGPPEIWGAITTTVSILTIIDGQIVYDAEVLQ